MKILLAALLLSPSVFGQITISGLSPISNVDVKQIRYFVIYSHRVASSFMSYAVYCQTPGCDTVYVDQADDKGFATLDDALQFLRDNQDYTLIRLVRVTDISIAVKQKTEVEHHPDTEKKTKDYSIDFSGMKLK